MTDLSQSKPRNADVSGRSQQSGASHNSDDSQHTPDAHHRVDDNQRMPEQNPTGAIPFDTYGDPNSDEGAGSPAHGDDPPSPAGRRRFRKYLKHQYSAENLVLARFINFGEKFADYERPALTFSCVVASDHQDAKLLVENHLSRRCTHRECRKLKYVHHHEVLAPE
ncbi:hypothetical protein BGX26_004637 [Mortierella sp. AD094]|nr:hypothetical protein BGX26_004637 [Mortierella sp. AD094]